MSAIDPTENAVISIESDIVVTPLIGLPLTTASTMILKIIGEIVSACLTPSFTQKYLLQRIPSLERVVHFMTLPLRFSQE